MYIKPQLMKDKYVARASAGLDDNSIAFSVLTHHFEGPVKMTFEDLIPMSILKKASPNLRTTFHFLIATVLYHWDWLKANLPSNHPFFASKIYSSNFLDLCKVKVVTGYFKDEKIGMRATGIPKAVALMPELAQMKRLMEDQPKMTCDMMLEKINSVKSMESKSTTRNYLIGHSELNSKKLRIW